MAGWASLKELLLAEVAERREEGCDTTGFAERIQPLTAQADLMKIYGELSGLRIKSDFPYCEPNGLEEILACASGTVCAKRPAADEKLYDRLYGAWLGRAIGCAMGKPFEDAPYVCGKEGRDGWEYEKLWLEGGGAEFPPVDYIPSESAASDSEGLHIICPDSQKGNIKYMETDDDIRYLVIGLLIGEKFGNRFTPDDVAGVWKNYLPAELCCTAERQAYINCLNTELTDAGERLEYMHGYLNPYREWIGAQIRVDHYAYANAGDPLQAAKAAYHDAIFSHVKNGVYGAMFIAAMIASAFTEKDPLCCVEAGLSVIPKTSRLYEDIRFAVEAAGKADSATEIYQALWKRFGKYNWVHTNNNAACCAAAAVFGKGDFVRTVSTAVGCGWDTDCNGATMGSFAGAMTGEKQLPEYLKNPLHDTLYSFVPGFHPISFSECARRSYDVFRSDFCQ